MAILGIETSCDETAIAVIDSTNKKVLCEALFSQIDLHNLCLLYTSPSPRDVEESRMPSSA